MTMKHTKEETHQKVIFSPNYDEDERQMNIQWISGKELGMMEEISS